MSTVKFVAELEGVREVSLTGTADLEYWRRQLAPEGLVPLEREGRAQILIVAADAKFRGLRFQEMSFSVLASPADAQDRQGAFLVQAFNSRRFFAFCERWWFKTPYGHGQVTASSNLPARIQLITAQNDEFRAQMRTPIDDANHAYKGGWEGPVHLPTGLGGRPRKFIARIRGETLTVPFRLGLDSFSIAPPSRAKVLQQLLDSGFAPREWQIRFNAYHAKSKTYADDRTINR
jgi:hypothetical protein